MAEKLTDVTRAFGRGETSLESLRAAARKERVHRQLADALLALITEWETTATDNSVSSREKLRDRAKALVPPDPPPPKPSPQDATAAMYGPGLRGQQRRT